VFACAHRARALPPRPVGDPKRVLLIGDPATGDRLASLIAYWGHIPYFFEDHRKALRVAESVEPEVALIEVAPGDTAALKLAARLRGMPGGPSLVIAVVAHADAAESRLLRWAGFDHVVHEPAWFVGLRAPLAADRRRPVASTLGALLLKARRFLAASCW
jgi:DNA-binding response OmpR family regulator